MDAKKLAGLGVPVLRDLFKQVFGESTASNNAGWLRRKLSETPDGVHGQCRSRVVRARDSGAAIWNKPLIFGAGEGEFGDAGDAAAAAEAEGQGEAGGVPQAPVAVKQEADAEMQEAAGAVPQGFGAAAEGCAKPGHHGHRSLKRSCTEASQSFRERVVAARCPSPSASGSASPAATHQEGTSPRAGSHSHKQQHRHHHHTHKQHGHQHTQHSSVQQQPSGSSLPGHVIHPDELADEWVGCQVMVYWPADNRWWAATICGLSTASQQLQLLYSDQTEELLAGHDFCELLRNGHLALAAGHALPPDSATGYTVSTQAGVAAAACGTSMLPSGACSLAPSGLAAPAYAAAAAATAEGLNRRVQSCQLPASLAGSSSMASQQELARSTSVSFGVKCGGSGVNFSGARVSVSGSGSGSGTGVDFEELAAKRQCYEPSINMSGSDGSNPAELSGFPGFYSSNGACMAAAEQQQQGPQAAQLGAWFASQQRQQQQLQMQMQANLQLQQQVQMQIQHQVAAHMSMQQAAGQVMQLQQPALSSPFAGGVGSPVVAAAGGAGGLATMQSDLAAYSMTHSAAAAAAAAAMAAAAANAASPRAGAVPCQQMQQLNLQLRQSPSPAAVAAPAAAAAGAVTTSTPPAMQQQVQQQQQAGNTATPKQCDHVVPEIEPQAHDANLQQQVPAAAAPAAAAASGFKVPQLTLQVPAAPLQPSSADEIDSLLTKAGRDLFELDDDLAAAGIDSIDGMDDMQQMEDDDALAAACGLGSRRDNALAREACSSGNNSSLCESMADELAVAGLEAEDAADYYMFGGAGSPKNASPQQLQQAAQQAAAAAAAAAVGAGSCQGLMYAAGVQGLVGGGAAAACGGASQLAGNGFKVAQAPCESSFAHMFDFY